MYVYTDVYDIHIKVTSVSSAGLGERLLAELVVPYMRRFVDVYVEELLRSLKGCLDATL